ncbi:MAG: cofactor-independent phosphoglycerate mutase [Thermodesulfobacteriota bacterium]
MKVDGLKYVILVGDGMGDEPIAALDGKTPLEAAKTPAMDSLASQGQLFRLRTVPEGYPPGSDVANLSLLGYLPEECYSGRAPLEAASMGVALPHGATAFRCNLVTLERQGEAVRMVDYSAGHITSEEAGELIAFLQQELGNDLCHLHPGVSYRHLLVFSGHCDGLQTVPPHDHTGQLVTEYWQRYQPYPALMALMEKASELLADHPVNQKRRAGGKNPANAVWLWGEGKSPSMRTLKEQYGVTGALISAVDLLRGIGVCAGMEIIRVPGATGYLDTNYAGKAAAAIEALKRHALVFVHVEAPDEASHQGELHLKLQAIGDFDQKIVQPIVDGLKERGVAFRLAVTMDHYTPLSIRTHSRSPVPLFVYDSRLAASGASYCEKNAATAPLLATGRDFLNLLLER